MKTIPLQVQINQIENGFLVAVPEVSRVTGPQGQPTAPVMKVEFGASFDDVCSILKKNWPLTAS